MRILMLLLSLPMLVSTSHAASAKEMSFATRLPADASLFVATERLGEVVASIGSSKFYRACYDIPAVSQAVAQGKFVDLAAEWSKMMAQPEAGMFRPMLTLFEDEIVIASTADGSRGIGPGLLQLVRVALLSQEHRMGGGESAVAERMIEAAGGVHERFGLESIVLAMRTKEKETVAPLLDMFLLQIPPEIAPMMSTETVSGLTFNTFTISPSMFYPSDSLATLLPKVIEQTDVIGSLMTTYEEFSLKARLGWIDDYLILCIEDHRGTLASRIVQGSGPSLADMDELNSIMSQVGDRPVRRVVLNLNSCRTAFETQLQELVSDMKICPTMMGFLAMTGLTAETAGEKLMSVATELFDPALAVVAGELDRGVRIVGDLYWAPDTASSENLGKTPAMDKMIPSSAVCWALTASENGPEQWRKQLDEQIKIRRMPLWTMLTMSQPPKERALQRTVTDLMVIMRDHLADALGDEGVFVMSWKGQLERFQDRELNLGIPELAAAIQIVNRDAVIEAGNLFGAKITELLVTHIDSSKFIPAPVVEQVKGGQRYQWVDIIPAKGDGLLPTIYLTDAYVVISSSPRLAEELYLLTRGKGDRAEWPEGELSRLIDGATFETGVLHLPEVIRHTGELLTGILDVARSENPNDPEIPMVAENIPAVMNLAQAFGPVWFHLSTDGEKGHLTAHMALQDLP